MALMPIAKVREWCARDLLGIAIPSLGIGSVTRVVTVPPLFGRETELLRVTRRNKRAARPT